MLQKYHKKNCMCQREVIRSLALLKGYYVDIDVGMDETIYHLYMDGTVYSDIDKLTKLFELTLEEIK